MHFAFNVFRQCSQRTTFELLCLYPYSFQVWHWIPFDYEAGAGIGDPRCREGGRRFISVSSPALPLKSVFFPLGCGMKIAKARLIQVVLIDDVGPIRWRRSRGDCMQPMNSLLNDRKSKVLLLDKGVEAQSAPWCPILEERITKCPPANKKKDYEGPAFPPACGF